MATTADTTDLFLLLESANGPHAEEIRTIVQDNLNKYREPSYLNSLVDFYMSCGYASRCQDILVGIRDPHDKHLFDKLNDCLKGGATRFRALTLLGHVVYKHPSWLHKISGHSLLNSLIKVLKSDTEVANVMSGCLIMVTLLPVIPSAIGAYLNDIFEAFTRIAAWHAKRPASVPEALMMHLHVALYSLFHRLYSMYPCNFLGYLRNYCNNNARDHLVVFKETIKPMLDYVRMHPLLVTFSKEAEVSMTRWKRMETHDIVVECARLSLDPIEGTGEVQNTFEALKSTVQNLRYSADPGSLKLHQAPPADAIVGQAAAEPREDWSPSFSAGLFTPPPFQREPPFPEALLEPMGAAERQPLRFRARTFSGSPTSYQSPVPPSPLSVEGSHFRFPVVGEAGPSKTAQAAPIAAPTPVKLARVPLSKAGLPAPSSLARVAQRTHDRDDLADSEVASITEGTAAGQGRESSPSAARDTPLSHRPLSFSRSGRGSATFRRSPFYESLQDIQRKRSYSQGKKMPRRATIEVSARRSAMRAHRSRSMPDLRLEAEAESEVEEAAAEPPLPPPPDTTEDRPQPGFPYERLFSAVLPQATQEPLCPGCQRSAAGQPLFMRMSPPEMLDHYLQLSDGVHAAKTEAAAKDLTAKDPRTLSGQLLLLHVQLLYERQKREVHAERNRRLQGKVKRVKVLEEQNSAMKDQMQLLEKEIVALSDNNAELRRSKNTLLAQKDDEIKLAKEELMQTTNQLVSTQLWITSMVKRIERVTAESDAVKKAHDRAQADIFNAHHELEAIQARVAENAALELEVKKLTAELLQATDLNQKYQDKVAALENYQSYAVELAALRDTYTHEMHTVRVTLQGKDAQLESAKCRLGELETLLIKKDTVIAEQKRLLKASKEEYEHQVKAVEDKYGSRRLICQHMESEILKLHQKMERVRAEAAQQRGRDAQVKRRSAEKSEAASAASGDTRKDPPKKEGPALRHEATVRRASEPIDIEPGLLAASGQAQRTRTRSVTEEEEEEEESPDSQDAQEVVVEERISGALEPITPQSLASIIDFEECVN